jgi:hypothetical protein
LSRKATASGKITNALATAQPATFYRLSPEAPRLTAEERTKILVNKRIQRAGKGLSGRAAGSLACVVAAIGLT